MNFNSIFNQNIQIIDHKPSWAHVGGGFAPPKPPLMLLGGPFPPLRATATAATADEFSWRIRPPSTRAGITYPVRIIPHSDIRKI